MDAYSLSIATRSPKAATAWRDEMTETYQVIDRQTGAVVGTFTNKARARAKRDRLDMAYGAVRYFVRIVGAAA